MRIVCATHQDLKGLIRDGGFREDLYHRLAEIVVEIPALREREGDSSLIAHALVKRFASENGRASMQLGDDAVAAIDAHPWPGNVRELENCIKRAVIMADGTRIERTILVSTLSTRTCPRSTCVRSATRPNDGP